MKNINIKFRVFYQKQIKEQLFYNCKEHLNRLWVDKISKNVDT